MKEESPAIISDLAAGVSISDIIADNATEGPESVVFGLADGQYAIDSEENAASFTIIDIALRIYVRTYSNIEINQVS